MNMQFAPLSDCIFYAVLIKSKAVVQNVQLHYLNFASCIGRSRSILSSSGDSILDEARNSVSFHKKSPKGMLMTGFEQMKIPIRFISTSTDTLSKTEEQDMQYRNTNVNIKFHVVGTGALSSSPSLYISTNSVRYLFNCGEGTLRSFSSERFLPKFDNVLVSHRCWRNIGGIPSIIQATSAIKLPHTITIHGPPDTDKVILHSQNFDDVTEANIKTHLAKDGPYSDDVMQIDQVVIHPQVARSPYSCSTSSTPHTATTTSSVTQCTGVPSPQQEQDKTRDTDALYCDYAVGFLCQPHDVPGRLSLPMCLDLDITDGKMLADLKRGNTVTLEDGQAVSPDQVSYPGTLAQPFIVLECPTLNHVDSLVNNEVWKKYQHKQRPDHLTTYRQRRQLTAATHRHRQLTAATHRHRQPSAEPDRNSSSVDIIVHFTPWDVLSDRRYQQWMRSFGAHTKHLLFNDRCNGVTLEEAYRLQTQLNLINPCVFPLLHEQPQQTHACTLDVDNVTWATAGLVYWYRRNAQDIGMYCTEGCVKLDYDCYKQTAVQQLKKSNITLTPASTPEGRLYPEVVFLGTGSTSPKPTRNVTAIMLQLSAVRSILLDCGEGTVAQMSRFYGPTQLPNVLANLSAVFISHLHSDHHMGLIGLVEARAEAFKSLHGPDALVPALHLLAPPTIKPWHSAMDKILPHSVTKSVIYTATNMLYPRSPRYSLDRKKLICDVLNVRNVETMYVIHRQTPFGLILTDQQGHKIVYSGDTMPCERLIRAGYKCDLLIHEATLEHSGWADGRKNRHSTISQAIKVGRRMRAKAYILTHFGGHSRIAPVADDWRDAIIAFDNMKVSLEYVHQLHSMQRLVHAMFADDAESKRSDRESTSVTKIV